MNINTKALKGVIEEVEASKLRQKAEADFQREAIKRAVKQHQLDGKAIRIVLQRRAMGDEKRDEQDYYVHAYEHALGGKKLAADALESGATIREAAAIGGISTGAAGNLAKVVQKSTKMDKPEDGDDGITETREVDDVGAAAGQPSKPSAPAEQSVNPGPPPGRESPRSVSGQGEQPGTYTNEAPATPSVGAVADDDLDIPAHLRGPSPANRRLGA